MKRISGIYTCRGFNRLPDKPSIVNSDHDTVEIVLIKDVTVSFSTNQDSEEVDFGEKLNLSCRIEGSRAPFFLKMVVAPDSGNQRELVYYDTSRDKNPATVNQKGYHLTYQHVFDSVTYNENGVYTCFGKNRASGNSVEEANVVRNIVIGKKNERIQQLCSDDQIFR